MESIESFVKEIATPRRRGMFNPWCQTCESEVEPQGWRVRQVRLKQHLSCPDPRLIVIGEAPGFRGARFTGMAFTSERLVLAGTIPRIDEVQGRRITTRNRPWAEPSATIVWKALYELGLADHTILFNAVPWHPEGVKGPFSNRTPSSHEKEEGRQYLEVLLQLFKGVQVVALGNTASDSLKTMGVQHTKVRHPANGGAAKFRAGMLQYVPKKCEDKDRSLDEFPVGI